jgi:dienelactone hydrolase
MKEHYNTSLAGLVALMAISILILSPDLAAGAPLPQSASTPEAELTPGRIIESVSCKSKPEQTYALYLPSSYSHDKLFPLIAAFDPGARGKTPVEHFKEAAERFGYIVCGSNNSRNGPWPPTAEAADAMLNDVVTRFPIDDKRVYLTGFSGGARVATKIAVLLSGRVSGVIGCGAGLAAGVEPSASVPFVYFGTVGSEDFNYTEMKQLDRALEAAGLIHRIHTFEGGHQWAPSELCVQAVEWMELQAMRAGKRTRDEAMIDRSFGKALASAGADEAADRVYQAYVGFSRIASDYKGLKDVAGQEKKAALLKETTAVKQAIKADRDQENEQRRRTAELFALRARLRDPATSNALREGDSPAAPDLPRGPGPPLAGNAGNGDDPAADRQIVMSELRGKLADLRRRTLATENTPDRALARRILNQFMASVIEPPMILMTSKKYDLAIANLTTDSELMPENSSLLYNLACAYSLKGDKRRAIEKLNKAVQKGFANAAALERDPDLDAIRGEAAFKKIVDELKQKN